MAAAAALIDAGVEEVLLFGSVARGAAGGDSDIDLVAIFADLDYAERAACAQRLVTLCTAAALTAETSLKALAVLHGESPPTEKEMKRAGHSIARGLDLVPEAPRAEAAAVFARLGVDPDALSAWRERSTYPDDADVLHADADRLAPTYAAMASEITALVATHLRQAVAPGPALDDAVVSRDSHAALLATTDVRTGTTTPHATNA